MARSTELRGVSRREAFKSAAGGALIASMLLSYWKTANAQTTGDIDALNFALNLSYLQSQFFSYVTTGAAYTALLGTGTPGTVTPGSKFAFDTVGTTVGPVASMMAEITTDSRNIATPMRGIIGALAIGQLALDITGGTTGPFAVVMQRAGVVAPGATFDPYGSEENVLYSAFDLKDIAVSAYRGLLPLLSNRVVVQVVTGMIATECHHSAEIRTLLYTRGDAATRIANADKIAAFRQRSGGQVPDPGISPVSRTYAGPTGTATVTTSRITPANANGEVAGRTVGQVLNLLYLSQTATTQGGFFPAGVNGTFRTSAGA